MARSKKPSADAIEKYTQLALERGGTVYGHGAVLHGPQVTEPEPPEDLDASEKRFQAEVCKAAGENGWKWHHHTISKRSKEGWPDLFLVKHRALAFELKVEPNKPSAGQLAWLESLQAAGIDAHLFYPSDWPEIVRILTEVPNGR